MEIELTLIGARNIKAADPNGKSDGYVVIHFNGETKKTKVIDKTLFPEWNETFKYKVEVGSKFEFHVWDEDRFSSDDYLGKVLYEIKKPLVNGETVIKAKKIDVKGFLYFSVKCISGGVEKTLKPLKKDRKMLLKVSVPVTRYYYQALPRDANDASIDYRKPQSEAEAKVQQKAQSAQKALQGFTSSLAKAQGMGLMPKTDFKVVDYYNPQNYTYTEKINIKARVGIECESMPVQYTKKDSASQYDKHESKEYFYVKAKVGEKIKFTFNCSFSKGSREKTAFTFGKWIVPDMLDGEKIEFALPSKRFFTFFPKVECVKSIYRDVDPKELPQKFTPQVKEKAKYDLVLIKANNMKSADFFSKSDPYFRIKSECMKHERRTLPIKNDKDPWFAYGFKVKAKPGTKIALCAFDLDTKSLDDPIGDAVLEIPKDLKENEKRELEMPLSFGKKATVTVSVRKYREISEFFISKFGPIQD